MEGSASISKIGRAFCVAISASISSIGGSLNDGSLNDGAPIDWDSDCIGSTIDESVTDDCLGDGIPMKGLLRKEELEDLLRLTGVLPGFLPWLKDGSSGWKPLDCAEE